MNKLLFAAILLALALPVYAQEAVVEEEYENFIDENEPKTKKPVKPMARPDIKLLRKNATSSSVKIVGLVNGEMLSSEDIDNRIHAFVLTTQIPLNKETEPMIFQKALHNAIDERLKIQDANKNGIKISEKEIDEAIKQFEKNNKIPAGQLDNILKKANVSKEVFRTQFESDLAWVRLIRKKMAGELNITQKEVEEAIEEAKKDISTPKYQVSEIVIKKNDARDLNGLVSNLRKDPRFELYAMQFSQAPSAASGGNLGWVNQGKLAPELETALNKMKEGSISNPINVNGDYYILKLNKYYNPDKDTAPVPNEEEIRKFLENQKLENFANKHLLALRQQAIIELRN